MALAQVFQVTLISISGKVWSKTFSRTNQPPKVSVITSCDPQKIISKYLTPKINPFLFTKKVSFGQISYKKVNRAPLSKFLQVPPWEKDTWANRLWTGSLFPVGALASYQLPANVQQLRLFQV